MNKQGITVLCKDFQPQGIRELWDLIKSSNLVHGVTGRRYQQEDCLCEDLKDRRVQAGEEISEVLPGDSHNVDAEGEARPAQRRNGAGTTHQFPPTPTASR